MPAPDRPSHRAAAATLEILAVGQCGRQCGLGVGTFARGALRLAADWDRRGQQLGADLARFEQMPQVSPPSPSLKSIIACTASARSASAPRPDAARNRGVGPATTAQHTAHEEGVAGLAPDRVTQRVFLDRAQQADREQEPIGVGRGFTSHNRHAMPRGQGVQPPVNPFDAGDIECRRQPRVISALEGRRPWRPRRSNTAPGPCARSARQGVRVEVDALDHRVGLEQHPAVRQPEVENRAVIARRPPTRGGRGRSRVRAPDQFELVHPPTSSHVKLARLNRPWAPIGPERPVCSYKRRQQHGKKHHGETSPALAWVKANTNAVSHRPRGIRP